MSHPKASTPTAPISVERGAAPPAAPAITFTLSSHPFFLTFCRNSCTFLGDASIATHRFELPPASAAQAAQRLGLTGMRERAAIASGTVDVESEPGKGTTVIVQIPLSGYES